MITSEIRAACDLKTDSKFLKAEKGESEFCGCHTIEFKKGLKQISHVVTIQTTNPVESTLDNPCPIAYFEIKTLSIGDKELKQFGLGLAG